MFTNNKMYIVYPEEGYSKPSVSKEIIMGNFLSAGPEMCA